MSDAPRSDPTIDGTSALDPTGDGAAAFPIHKEDGRNLRRERNRDAVIAALIDLIRDGDMAPSVAAIADRAAVSHRSVFRYFEDLNDLARTAIETEFRNTVPLSVIPDVGEGSLDERIDALIVVAIRTFQRTHRLGLVMRSRAIELEEMDRGMQTIHELRLAQVRRQFALELEAMDEQRAEAIAVAITGAVGLDSYDLQYRVGGRSTAEISAMWRITLHALLD